MLRRLSPVPFLHCMCLIAHIKRNEFFFDLSTSDKSNSVTQTGGKCTTKGKLQDWQWDQSEAFAQSSSSKRGPPSLSRKQDVSCHMLTQSEKNLPGPDVTLSQDELSADISSGGPGAPPSHLKSQFPSFLGAGFFPLVGTESSYWPAQHGSKMSCTSGGGVKWRLWDHFITSPEAPFLPATANKASWVPLPTLGELHICLTHNGA